MDVVVIGRKSLIWVATDALPRGITPAFIR